MIMRFTLFSCGLLAAGRLVAATNLTDPTHAPATPQAETNRLIEAEFKQLNELDDAAVAEVDRWIRENQAFAARGGGVPNADLNRRIRARLEPVRKAYEDFIARHPNHAGARLAFGSFLHDQEEEEAAEAQFKKGLELDPKNPAAWNNLANHFSHDGNVQTAFAYYAKAIELNPAEPLYYRNLAGVVYLFRKDAMEHYKINEQQAFEKALELYTKAFQLDPRDFNLATDLAQTHYALRPTRTDEALRAWTNALALARDDLEREGIHVHLARFKALAGHTNEARAHLTLVTNSLYTPLKERISVNLDRSPEVAKATNTPPAAADLK